MATVTELSQQAVARSVRRTISPADHGLAMDFEVFQTADLTEGWLYELAQGIVIVTEIPGTSHGRIVRRLARLFDRHDEANPGRIHYLAGGAECRLRLPGMKSDRHPDQAVYLTPEPIGSAPWTRWVPEIVVEVVSESCEDRDYVEKREEYLRAGVVEYWILDPRQRRMLVLIKAANFWEESLLDENGVHRTELLPGLEARVGDLLGPALEDQPV